MMPYFLTQAELMLRILLAGLCGAIIGYERENRLKEAGIRTHLIVALASALMTVISKYGFFDVLNECIKVDPSRIAAGIVAGVGFLGAGTIFVRKQAVNGLTTAAGIWATAGVGMAIGSGMYVVGICSSILIIIFQILLHKNLHWLKIPISEQISLQIEHSTESITYLQTVLSENNMEILNFKAEKQKGNILALDLYIKLPERFTPMDIMEVLKDNPYMISIEV